MADLAGVPRLSDPARLTSSVEARLRPEDVVSAYLLILGRRPESQATIDAQCALPDLATLGERLLRSAEFRARFRHELLSLPEVAPSVPPASPATVVPLRRLALGAGGEAAALLGEGWSVGEQDGRWTIGAESLLSLPDVPAHEEYLLRLELKPYHTPKMLQLEVAGITVLRERVRRETVLAVRIAGELISADRTLRLRHAAPERPCDHSSSRDGRALAVKVRSVSLEGLDGGAPPAEARALAPGFESLGDDCAFGFYESVIGHQPVSLFRYNSVPLPQLVELLENRLDGFPRPDSAALVVGKGNEYVFHERSIGLIGHTSFSCRGALPTDEGLLLARQLKRMLFLKRMFNQRVDGDGTIFVYRPFVEEPLGAMMPVWRALRRRGRNALLWVCDADEQRPCGSVERLEDGLLRGAIDPALEGTELGSPRMLAWAVLCRRAYRLWPGHD